MLRYTSAAQNEFSSPTELTVKAPEEEADSVLKAGLAVDDRTGQIFAHLRNGFHPEGLVSEFALSGKFLDEAVFEGESSGLAVELSSNEVYVDEVTSLARLEPGGAELERLEVPGGHGSGVAVDSARGEVYVADSLAGVVDVYGLEPPGVPTVGAGSSSASVVTADSASFAARVNPRGASTEYYFQYEPCATATSCATGGFANSESTPVGSAGAEFALADLNAHVQGLAPGTPYHFRVVAENGNGKKVGEERTFTTQPAASGSGSRTAARMKWSRRPTSTAR